MKGIDCYQNHQLLKRRKPLEDQRKAPSCLRIHGSPVAVAMAAAVGSERPNFYFRGRSWLPNGQSKMIRFKMIEYWKRFIQIIGLDAEYSWRERMGIPVVLL